MKIEDVSGNRFTPWRRGASTCWCREDSRVWRRVQFIAAQEASAVSVFMFYTPPICALVYFSNLWVRSCYLSQSDLMITGCREISQGTYSIFLCNIYWAVSSAMDFPITGQVFLSPVEHSPYTEQDSSIIILYQSRSISVNHFILNSHFPSMTVISHMGVPNHLYCAEVTSCQNLGRSSFLALKSLTS